MGLFRSIKRLPVNEVNWLAPNGEQGQIRWRGADFALDQANLVARDLAWLRAALVNITSDLSSYDSNPLAQARIERWFGVGITRDQVAEAAGVVNAVTRGMDGEVLHFRNDAGPGFAWQTFERKVPVVTFGTDYWDWSAAHGRSYRLGVFIHELTHCYPGTGDWAYYDYDPQTKMPVPNALADLGKAGAEQIRGEGPARFNPNTLSRWLGFQDTPEWRIKTADSYAGFLREFYLAGIPDER